MASVKKYSRELVSLILNHNSRKPKTYRNQDVNVEKSHLNVAFINKGYSGYKKRIEELYVRNQKDVKTLCEWVVTCPIEFNDAKYIYDRKQAKECMNGEILRVVSDFLCSRYGEENCIQSIIHFDESGEPHLHFCFIPVVDDPRKHSDSGLKVSSSAVINKAELNTFHSDLRDYINDAGLNPDLYGSRPGDLFYTGITKAQGGNRTVNQLKRERELLRVINQKDRQIEKLQERVQELERKYEHPIEISYDDDMTF